MKPFIARTPLIVLTGFLGSGKTTLLRELLLHPRMDGTAVLINELGAVGLDHHLLWPGNDATLVLENGCICCSVRDDFISTLQDLFWKRLHRQIPRFKRVLIETTGVAVPAPVVNLLLSDALLAERYRLDTVITTVDAVLGQRHIDQHWETVRQIAAADTLVITKADLAAGHELTQLEHRLAALNPLAVRLRAVLGQVAPELLFDNRPDSERNRRISPAHRPFLSAAQAATAPVREGERTLGGFHDARIKNVTLHLSGPLERARIVAALSAVLGQFGDQLLRVKGLVDVAGEARPVVVQAVGDRLFPLETLDAWPAGERASNLVFITAGLRPQAVRDTLETHFPGSVSTAV